MFCFCRHASVQPPRVDSLPQVPRTLGNRVVPWRPAVRHGVRRHPVWARRGDSERTALFQEKNLSGYVANSRIFRFLKRFVDLSLTLLLFFFPLSISVSAAHQMVPLLETFRSAHLGADLWASVDADGRKPESRKRRHHASLYQHRIGQRKPLTDAGMPSVWTLRPFCPCSQSVGYQDFDLCYINVFFLVVFLAKGELLPVGIAWAAMLVILWSYWLLL